MLRRQAKARLKAQNLGSSVPQTLAEKNRILNELQIHQIELEMQNTQLEQERECMGALLETYTNLYDFSPIGYFSLNEQGQILDANLTGASLLFVERSLLAKQRFQNYVSPISRPVFQVFLKKLFSEPEKQICEVQLVPALGQPLWTDLQGVVASKKRVNQKWCRIAVSDLTTLKHEQEARKQLEGIAAVNNELRKEIIQRQRLEDSLKKSKANAVYLLAQSERQAGQLRYLSRRLLSTQEEERKRISRELHDEIVQTLLGINVHLANLTLKVPIDIKGFQKKIEHTKKLVEKSVNICHRFARELRPTILDDLGLIPALKQFIKEFIDRTHILVDSEVASEIGEMDDAKRTVIYRIIQSALSNVDKHAQATSVKIRLRQVGDLIQLSIHDNGKSFEVDKILFAKRHLRLGLLGSRERVEMVGGKFEVTSNKGKGTTINVEIPLD